LTNNIIDGIRISTFIC